MEIQTEVIQSVLRTYEKRCENKNTWPHAPATTDKQSVSRGAGFVAITTNPGAVVSKQQVSFSNVNNANPARATG
jgi:hypothetical protein